MSCSCSKMGGTRLRLLLLLSLVLVVPSGFTQQLAPDLQRVPELQRHGAQIKVNVREVILDVTAYDGNGYTRRGEPIPGLKKEDFEVLEDGKPQDIRYFDDHGTGDVSVSPSEPTEATLQPTQGLSVVLIDQASLGFTLQPWLLTQLEHFLEDAPKGSRIALFALSPRLRVMHAFTTDHTALLAALHAKGTGLHPLPSPFLRTQDEVDLDKQPIASLRAEAAQHGGTAAAMAEQLTRLQDGMAQTEAMLRTTNTLAAFQQIARYLACFPGRKSLLWVSSTFTDRPFGLDTEPVPQVKFTADMLAAARVAVYPIDATGLDAPSGPHAAPFVPGIVNAQAAAAALESERMEAALERNGSHTTMDDIASKTGGEAYYNTNGLAWAMNRVVRQANSYYTLAYSSSVVQGQESYARIQVHLKGHHGFYRLSYRPGYFTKEATALKEGAVDNSALDAYMDPSMPIVSQIRFHMLGRAVSPTEAASSPTIAGNNHALQGPLQRYHFTLAIPFRDVRFTSDDSGVQRSELLLDFAAYDGKGTLINSSMARYSPALTVKHSSPGEQDGLELTQDLDLPPGRYLLRIGVYDLNTARVGTADTAILVAP